MCRYFFNRRFYPCLYQAYVESATKNCSSIKYRPVLVFTLSQIVFFLVIPSCIVLYFYAYGLDELALPLLLALFFFTGMLGSFINELLDEALKIFKAEDTEHPPSDLDVSSRDYHSEELLSWHKGYRDLTSLPHSSISPSEEYEVLRSLRRTNRRLRQNYEKLCSQQSPDSAITETSFIETEQDSHVGSNLLQQAAHGSRHPSRSLEDNPSFVLKSSPSSESEEYTGLVLRTLQPSGSSEECTGSSLSRSYPSVSSEEYTGLTLRSRHLSGSEERARSTLEMGHSSGSLEKQAGLSDRSRYLSGSSEKHTGSTFRSHHSSGSLEKHTRLELRGLQPAGSSEEQRRLTRKRRHPSESSDEHTGLTRKRRHSSESCEEHEGLTFRSLQPSGSSEEHTILADRSLHPSGSLEEQAGSTQSLNQSVSTEDVVSSATSSTSFVTVAEVHRSQYDDSD